MAVEASNTRVRLDVPSSVVLSLLLLTFRLVSIIAWFFFDAASFATSTFAAWSFHTATRTDWPLSAISRLNAGAVAFVLVACCSSTNTATRLTKCGIFVCIGKSLSGAVWTLRGVLVTIGNFL